MAYFIKERFCSCSQTRTEHIHASGVKSVCDLNFAVASKTTLLMKTQHVTSPAVGELLPFEGTGYVLIGLLSGFCIFLTLQKLCSGYQMGKKIGFSKYHIKYLCVIIQFTLNKFASIVFPFHLSAFCGCSSNIFTGTDFHSNSNI